MADPERAIIFGKNLCNPYYASYYYDYLITSFYQNGKKVSSEITRLTLDELPGNTLSANVIYRNGKMNDWQYSSDGEEAFSVLGSTGNIDSYFPSGSLAEITVVLDGEKVG